MLLVRLRCPPPLSACVLQEATAKAVAALRASEERIKEVQAEHDTSKVEVRLLLLESSLPSGKPLVRTRLPGPCADGPPLACARLA